MNGVSTKISAGALAGALAGIAVWSLGLYHINVPAAQAVEISTLLGWVVGFTVPETAIKKASKTMAPTAADGTEYHTYGGVNERPDDVNHPDNLHGPVAGSSTDPALNPAAGVPGNITPATVTEQNIGGPEVDSLGTPTGNTVAATFENGNLSGSEIIAPAPTAQPVEEGVVNNEDGSITINGVTYRPEVVEAEPAAFPEPTQAPFTVAPFTPEAPVL